jgi:hypothetical protein
MEMILHTILVTALGGIMWAAYLFCRFNTGGKAPLDTRHGGPHNRSGSAKKIT